VEVKMSVELEGVPEGWRAVRWGKPKRGEWTVLNNFVHRWGSDSVVNWLVVEPVAPITERSFCSDQAVRPFKNSEEFLEACNGHFWLLNIQTGGSEFVAYVDDNGIETLRGATSWEDLVECYEFPDGRVGGHENL